jgi:hypothetical protein
MSPAYGQYIENHSLDHDTVHTRVKYSKKLKSLEQKYHIAFAFDSEIDLSGMPDEIPENNSLEETLKALFSKTEIEYVIQDDIVLLRNKLSAVNGPYTLTGIIIDATSRRPMPYTGIMDSNGKQHITDSLGTFKLVYEADNIPEKLTFNYLGFAQQSINLNPDKRFIKVQLTRTAQRIPTINISSTLFQSKPVSHISTEEVETLSMPSAILTEDILRNIQLLPGVAAHKDISSAVEIRGASSFETMVNLDGIVIYNPYHFYNLFSTINSDYIHSSKVYKNELPLEYTSKTGGLIAMKSGDLSDPTFKLRGGVDLFHTSLIAELPLSKKTGILVGGRTSYTDLTNRDIFNTISGTKNTQTEELRSDLIQQLDPSFNFYDLNAKFQTRFHRTDAFDINLFFSSDHFDNTHIIKNARNKNVNTFLFDYSDKTDWNNTGISSNYRFNILKNHTTKILMQYSSSTTTSDFSFLNKIGSGASSRTFSFNNDLNNTIEDLHLNISDQFGFGKTALFKYGLEAGTYSTSSQISLDTSAVFSNQNYENVFSIFQSVAWKNKRINWKLGGRLSYLSQNDKWLFNPMLTISTSALKMPGIIYGSASINHQFLTQFSYENLLGQVFDFWILADGEFPVLRSYNTMLGYQLDKEKTYFSTEIYFRYKEGLTEFALVNPGIPAENIVLDDHFKLFNGSGLVLGMDLMLRKTIGSFKTQLAYTLSTHLNAFDNIFQGRYFPDNDHRTHQAKWLNSYSFNAFEFFANSIYSSGKPYLDVSNLDNNRSRKELNPETNLKFLPPYFRIDIGLQYTPQIARERLKFGVSVFNLLNRQNVYSIQYIKPVGIQNQNKQEFIPAGAESTLLERTLNISLKFQF